MCINQCLNQCSSVRLKSLTVLKALAKRFHTTFKDFRFFIAFLLLSLFGKLFRSIYFYF